MKILHVFRAPVGGLFRHVRDLSRGQAELGHEVAIVCDASTGGTVAENLLENAGQYCSLGIRRIVISRMPGFGDMIAAARVSAIAKSLGADIIHGHGAKGGLYARLAGKLASKPSVYSPHGGSLHYDWGQPAGLAFLSAEWSLARLGDGIIFVCEYEKSLFQRKIGLAGIEHAVVHNGLWPEEFAAIPQQPDASDFVFIGDMRPIKGVDVLIEALALIKQRRAVSAALVGDGPNLAEYKALAKTRGLEGSIAFPGRLPTATALSLGRTMVLPSRSELFPYVILEAAAAAKPVVATAAGGIPEAIPLSGLVPPGDAIRLAGRMMENLTDPAAASASAEKLREKLKGRFDALRMSEQILSFCQRIATSHQKGTAR